MQFILWTITKPYIDPTNSVNSPIHCTVMNAQKGTENLNPPIVGSTVKPQVFFCCGYHIKKV
jgi:hypothetical protein